MRSLLETDLGSRIHDFRPYQMEAEQAFRAKVAQGLTSGYIVIGTGGGKTTVYLGILEKTAGKALILLPSRVARDRVLEDLHLLRGKKVARLDKCTLQEALEADIVVATCQKQLTKLEEKRLFQHFPPDHFGIVIADEAHDLMGPEFHKVSTHFASAVQLATTATPQTATRHLSSLYPTEYFSYPLERLVEDDYAPSVRGIRYMIEGEHLDKVRTVSGDYDKVAKAKALNVGERFETTAKILLESSPTDTGIVYMPSVELAKKFVAHMRKLAPDFSIDAIDGKTKNRETLLANFNQKKPRFLVCKDLLNQSIDIDHLNTIIIADPTRSVTRYMQRIGRGMRPDPANPDKVTTVHDLVSASEAYMTEQQMTLHGVFGVSRYHPDLDVLSTKKRSEAMVPPREEEIIELPIDQRFLLNDLRFLRSKDHCTTLYKAYVELTRGDRSCPEPIEILFNGHRIRWTFGEFESALKTANKELFATLSVKYRFYKRKKRRLQKEDASSAAYFVNSDMRGLHVTPEGAFLEGKKQGDCDGFENCNLRKAKFQGITVKGTYFSGEKELEMAQFLDVHFTDVDFSEANLHFAQFSGRFEGCSFANANLEFSEYCGVEFVDCDFTDASLAGGSKDIQKHLRFVNCRFNHESNWPFEMTFDHPNVTFEGCTGLRTTFKQATHHAPGIRRVELITSAERRRLDSIQHCDSPGKKAWRETLSEIAWLYEDIITNNPDGRVLLFANPEDPLLEYNQVWKEFGIPRKNLIFVEFCRETAKKIREVIPDATVIEKDFLGSVPEIREALGTRSKLSVAVIDPFDTWTAYYHRALLELIHQKQSKNGALFHDDALLAVNVMTGRGRIDKHEQYFLNWVHKQENPPFNYPLSEKMTTFQSLSCETLSMSLRSKESHFARDLAYHYRLRYQGTSGKLVLADILGRHADARLDGTVGEQMLYQRRQSVELFGQTPQPWK